MIEEEIEGTMPRIIKRISLLFIGATLIGLLICFATGRWSVKGFRDIQFGLGGILLAFGYLESWSYSSQLKGNTYWFRRSKGFDSLEERPPHSLRKLFWSESEQLVYYMSGILTIGTGLGICAIYG